MDSLLVVREEIMGLLEQARTAKYVLASSPRGADAGFRRLIGSSTEAEVVISTPSPLILKHCACSLLLPLTHANEQPTPVDVLKTLFIVSDVTISENVDPSSRAWHYSKTLAGSSPSPPLAPKLTLLVFRRRNERDGPALLQAQMPSLLDLHAHRD